MEQWEKTFFSKKSPKRRLDTWERFGQFRNFEIFLIFSLNFFMYLAQNLSPENWTHFF